MSAWKTVFPNGIKKEHPVTVFDVQLSTPKDDVPPYYRSGPLSLLRHDLGIVLKYAPEIPNIFLPLPSYGMGKTPQDIAFLGTIAQIFFLVVSFVFTGIILSSFFVGMPTPIVAVTSTVILMWILTRLQGKLKIEKSPDNFEDEAWLFVNGIATSNSGLQLILDHLHKLFGRNVVGIHNRTAGIWWDLVECMIQRDLSWPTVDVRVGYQEICTYIQNPKKKKVVLMCHSQGGIIMSAWVDQLLADFSAAELSKVEIYTFAAAANHFSVPSVDLLGGLKKSVFAIVEHFVNTRDYVSLIGLIEFAPISPSRNLSGKLPDRAAEGRFAGRTFKRHDHTGHLLLSHYLSETESILDNSTVQEYSQLVKYMGGKRAPAEDRIWRDTTFVPKPAVSGPQQFSKSMFSLQEGVKAAF